MPRRFWIILLMNSLVFGGMAREGPAATVGSVTQADAEASITSEL